MNERRWRAATAAVLGAWFATLWVLRPLLRWVWAEWRSAVAEVEERHRMAGDQLVWLERYQGAPRCRWCGVWLDESEVRHHAGTAAHSVAEAMLDASISRVEELRERRGAK